MGDFPLAVFGLNLAVTAGAIAVLMLATFAAARRLGRHSVVDVAWGAGFVVVAVVSAVLSTGHGDVVRSWLVTMLTVVWGTRLSVHIAFRSRGQGEDPRYSALLAGAPGNRDAYALRVVYLLQGALIWFVSLPLQVAVYSGGEAGWVMAAGALVWTLGFAFEAIGDGQLARFRADPANRERIMDRGLWAWTRHPNYFGDACVWWGFFLIAADSWAGVLTLPAPLVMTWLLTRGSGRRLLEQRMNGRPGWEEYTRRTSAFVPKPPRR
ncbi:DUF1295 domain-containing protein [Allosalinactinospora lopnorensis]|uniref:DUF1295 domain-containing protein n=1 Tax=Allosalinactinospora lopnorensis TaxID=1352348 RepID=UPI000623FAA4|nr:DUF1295 domain-containing protein [Allosalinactinospora lopnorensis]